MLASDGRVSASIDDQPAGEFQFEMPVTGAVGLMTKKAKVYFDNVTVNVTVWDGTILAP